MGNHDGCSLFRSFIECCLNDLFASNIDCSCRFVENQDVWLFDNTSSDRNSLPLTSTEFRPRVPNNSIISLPTVSGVQKGIEKGQQYFGQLINEIMGECFFTCSLDQFLLTLIRIMLPLRTYKPVFYILQDRVVKEEGFLLNQTDLRSPPP